jgi:hypothetical protein
MKRLFEVNGSFFDNKEDAKAVRDETNLHAGKGKQCHVKLGPDHWRFGLGKKTK